MQIFASGNSAVILEFCKYFGSKESRKRYYLCNHVNPKRPGLFGQLDTRGGRILPFLRKRSLTPLNLIFEQQTESHMKAVVLS